METKDIIETLLGAKIMYSEQASHQNDIMKYVLKICNPELFTKLSEYFGNNGDNYYFQIKGLNIDRLMKYTDGTYSSIIKGATKIEGKKGYELLNPIDIVYDIFVIVKRYFCKELAQLFNHRINTNAEQVNNLLNILEIQKYSKIKAYSLFLREVYEEIDVATKYPKHSLITATNLQNIRIELLTIFYSNAEEIKLNLSLQEVDFNKLFNDYINLKYITEYNIIALILEYVLAERIDDKSIERLNSKINSIRNMYDEINSLIYSTADIRSENREVIRKNVKNRWKYFFQQVVDDYNLADKIGIEVENLKKFLMSIDDNETDDEIFAIVDEFIKKRKKILGNIKIVPALPNK